jgi:hypothetical protein
MDRRSRAPGAARPEGGHGAYLPGDDLHARGCLTLRPADAPPSLK